MKKIIKFYKSENRFLFFAYLFLFLGVYNVFLGIKRNYEIMFLVAVVQFLIFYIRTWIKNKEVNKNQ